MVEQGQSRRPRPPQGADGLRCRGDGGGSAVQSSTVDGHCSEEHCGRSEPLQGSGEIQRNIKQQDAAQAWLIGGERLVW